MDASKPGTQFFFERVPAEKPGQARPGTASFAIFALLLLALFVAINLGVRVYLNNYTPNFGLWLIRQKWQLLLNLEDSQDVLILGDSTADQGLVPEIIQEETGLTAVNLATVANMTFMNDVWMLNQYLQEHDPPKYVLIMNSYQMWHRMPNLQAINTIPFLSIPNRDQVLVPSPNISTLGYVGQQILRYTPTYSESQSLRGLLRTILQIPPNFNLAVEQHYTLSPLGTYSVYEQDASDVEEDINNHFNFLELRTPSIRPENELALAQLKALAAQYEMQIFLLNAPLADEVANSPDFPIYFRFMDQYLQAFAAGEENIHYIARVYSFPRSGMESADHMLRPTADEFTRLMITELGLSQ